MTDLKKMTVAASGKLRQVAYDILNEQTRLLSWQQGGKVPQEQFDSWLAEAERLYEDCLAGTGSNLSQEGNPACQKPNCTSKKAIKSWSCPVRTKEKLVL